MQKRNCSILCIGEMLWDRLPSGAKPGGAPMNVALHLKRFGHEVIFASRIGKDTAGSDLSEFLKQNGLDTSLIQIDDYLPTSEVLVYLDENKNATYEICKPVAWDNLQFTPELERVAQEAGYLIFGSLAARNLHTRNTLYHLLETRALRILDVNLRPPWDQREIVEKLLSKADIAKMNFEEMQIISGWNGNKTKGEKEQMIFIVENYCLSGLCVTNGENGAILYMDGKFSEHPGYKVRVADTVGAGDAFLASLTDSLIRQVPADEMLAMACAAGSLVASKPGAVPDYSLEEISTLRHLKVS